MLDDPTFFPSIQPELEPKERVLWVGRPDAKRMALRTAPLFLFAIPWTAHSIHFMIGWADHDWGSYLFQGSFVLTGLGMMTAPLWGYLKAKRTVYGITSHRVIILTTGRSRTVQSYGEGDLSEIVRTERSDGSGDLSFSKRQYKDGDGDQRTEDVKFVGVPKVREVERILRATFNKEIASGRTEP